MKETTELIWNKEIKKTFLERSDVPVSNSMNHEAKKTISTRLSGNDADLFLTICEEYKLTQSEAIRCLVQAFISKIFNSDHTQVKELFSIQDFDAFQRKRETEKFYNNFKLSNQKELSRR